MLRAAPHLTHVLLRYWSLADLMTSEDSRSVML